MRPIARSERCPGTLPRRGFLRLGLLGLASLGLADLLRLESAAAVAGAHPASDKSLIVLWLWGGPSHMETFDLKPEAPPEYRGEFLPIATSAGGVQISELLPRLAQVGDKFSLIRSLSHDSPGHVNSTHTLVTGYPGELVEAVPYQPKYPDLWSVVSKVRGERVDGVPAHVGLPRVRYNGSAYLGGGFDPLFVTSDPNGKNFKVPNLALSKSLTRAHLNERVDLLKQFDSLRRTVDDHGTMDSLDCFNQKAVSMLARGDVGKAFDIGLEDPKTRDRYGRHTVGQRCLLARRLIEAGVRIVTVDFAYVEGQKARSWDDHASVWNIFTEMKHRLPVLDQVVSTLIADLHDRGLQNDVLLLVMGEMSHTPRLSNFQGQPGREHWGHSMSVFLSGGGMRMGQAIGATNNKGDEVIDRLVRPNDLLATLYQYFGVPANTQFTSRAGRPTPILPSGTPIGELL